MIKLIHKLLLQFYFGGQTPMSYAASIFLFNLIEAILEIILYYICVYCGLCGRSIGIWFGDAMNDVIITTSKFKVLEA